jgi:hypothetical protein
MRDRPDKRQSGEWVMWLEQLQDEITLRLDRGQKLADVEAELVDSAVALNDDERAALWLFAWSYRASERPDAGQVLGGLAHD